MSKHGEQAPLLPTPDAVSGLHDSQSASSASGNTVAPSTADDRAVDRGLSVPRLILLYIQHIFPLYFAICVCRHLCKRRPLRHKLELYFVTMIAIAMLPLVPPTMWLLAYSPYSKQQLEGPSVSLTESLAPLLILAAIIGYSCKVELGSRLRSRGACSTVGSSLMLCLPTYTGLHFDEAHTLLTSGLATASATTLDMAASYHFGMPSHDDQMQPAEFVGTPSATRMVLRHLPSVVQRLAAISEHSGKELGRLAVRIVEEAINHRESNWSIVVAGVRAFVVAGLPLGWQLTRTLTTGQCDSSCINHAIIYAASGTGATIVLAVATELHIRANARRPFNISASAWQWVTTAARPLVIVIAYALIPAGRSWIAALPFRALIPHLLVMFALEVLFSWVIGTVNVMYTTVAALKRLKRCMMGDNGAGESVQMVAARPSRHTLLDMRNPSHVLFVIEMRKVTYVIGEYLMKGPTRVVLAMFVLPAAGVFAVLVLALVLPQVRDDSLIASPYFLSAAIVAGLTVITTVLVVISAATSVNSAQRSFTRALASMASQVESWRAQAPTDYTSAECRACGGFTRSDSAAGVGNGSGNAVGLGAADTRDAVSVGNEAKESDTRDIMFCDDDGRELQRHSRVMRSGTAWWKVEVTEGGSWMVGLASTADVRMQSRGVARVTTTLELTSAGHTSHQAQVGTSIFTLRYSQGLLEVAGETRSLAPGRGGVMLVFRGAAKVLAVGDVSAATSRGGCRDRFCFRQRRTPSTHCLGHLHLLLRKAPSIQSEQVDSLPWDADANVVKVVRDQFGMAWVGIKPELQDVESGNLLWTAASPHFMQQVLDDPTLSTRHPDQVSSSDFYHSSRMLSSAVVEAQLCPVRLKLMGVTMDAHRRAFVMTTLGALATLVVRGSTELQSRL